MEYRVDDRSLSGETFLDFVQQVWPGAYNLEQTRAALSKTMNFTAWDGGQLAGCLRVLTDGCFFGTAQTDRKSDELRVGKNMK